MCVLNQRSINYRRFFRRFWSVLAVLALFGLSFSAALAAVGEMTLLTQADGAAGDGDSNYGGVSSTNQLTVFSSKAANLVPGQPDPDGGKWDIFLWNGSQMVLVSAVTDPANDGDSIFPTLSSDGKYIAFQSRAEGFVNQAADGIPPSLDLVDIFLAELNADRDAVSAVYRVSRGVGAAAANNHSGNVTAEGNPNLADYHPVADIFVDEGGQVSVVFESLATNLVSAENLTNPQDKKDLYLFNLADATTRTLTRAGRTFGFEANGASYHPAFSQDGRFLVFVSEATNFWTGANEAAQPIIPSGSASIPRVFLLDRNYDSYEDTILDEFAQSDNPAVSYALLSVNPFSGQANNQTAKFPSLAFDYDDPARERLVVFQSKADNLVAADTNGFGDIFLAALMETRLPDETNPNKTTLVVGEMELISRSMDGAQADQASFTPAIASQDGSIIAFTSYAANLVDGDDNFTCPSFPPPGESIPTANCSDIFSYDRELGFLWRVSILPDGQDSSERSAYPILNESGRYVTFTSFASLVEGITLPVNTLQIYQLDQGAPPGNPSVLPSAWDFGALGFNTTAEKQFTIRFLDATTLDAAGPAGFRITGDGFSVLHNDCAGASFNRGDHCTFSVRYTAFNSQTLSSGQVLVPLNGAARTLTISLTAESTSFSLFLPLVTR